MARKFLLLNGAFRMGNVSYHKDLLPQKASSIHSMFNRPKVQEPEPVTKGGGRWDTDNEKKILFLWGSSMDFGYAEPEEIKKALESEGTWISQSLNGYQVMHSPVHSDILPKLDTFTLLTTLKLD